MWCFGYDITGYDIPEGCEFIKDWVNLNVDVITFFDVLEHFEDPYMIKDLNAKYVILSFPWCHYISDEWFENWKHRKPNEHLWHFNKESLVNFMSEVGYDVINVTNVEDIIRKNNLEYSNILTGVFKKR